MELLLSNPSDQAFVAAMRTYHLHEYRSIRSKWKNELSQSRQGIKLLLDSYFEKIFVYCFDASGRMQYPSNLT
jgi:hypothetical protein